MKMKSQSLVTSAATKRKFAFTLLEVMIAVAIFFMATFSILALVSRWRARCSRCRWMRI
jgi:type II secretory pathway pseudopilin PulG